MIVTKRGSTMLPEERIVRVAKVLWCDANTEGKDPDEIDWDGLEAQGDEWQAYLEMARIIDREYVIGFNAKFLHRARCICGPGAEWTDLYNEGCPIHGTVARCYDCGRTYGAPGFPDLVVPHDIWNKHISPSGNEGGLLCPSCMCARAELAGIQCEATFGSGPFCTSTARRALSTSTGRRGQR